MNRWFPNKKYLDLSYITWAWLLIFALLPLTYCAIKSFIPNHGYCPSIGNYRHISSYPHFYIIMQSYLIAFASTLLCILISYPVAIFLVWNSWVDNSVLTPLWTAAIFYPFLGNSVLRLYSLKYFLLSSMNPFIPFSPSFTIPLAMVYILFPFALVPIYLSLSKLPRCYIEAAKDLGASQSQIFKRIILPLTSEGAMQGAFMVFMTSLSCFYIVNIFGQGRIGFISTVIKEQALKENNFHLACATSIAFMIPIKICDLIPRLLSYTSCNAKVRGS